MGLVVLVGVSGSGKSTFARAHFKPTEVVSSDFCRGLVADDENDQSATPDAFDVLHYIVGTRLRRGLLTVVDATNVQQAARASLVKLAKSHDVLVDAIVLDVPESVAVERNTQRPDRDFGGHVVSRQHRDLKRSLRRLTKEGFRRVHVLRGTDADRVGRRSCASDPWNDRRDDPRTLRHHRRRPRLRLRAPHPARRARLADRVRRRRRSRRLAPRGPPGRLRRRPRRPRTRTPPACSASSWAWSGSGTALCVSGNHEAKLVRALKGAKVTVSHGLAESLAQLEAEPEDFRKQALDFMDGLISHYVLDDGRLVVAHAGLKEAYHGRSSGRVRAFALYGDTTGETDEYGLPGPLSVGAGVPRPGDGRLRAHARCPRPSGSTTPSASTPASSSAAR